MKTLGLLVTMVLLTGCAGTVSSSPDPDPLTALGQIAAVDLDAAQAIAVAHNDTIAAMCFPVLKKYLGATPTGDQIKGVISAFEKARVTRLGVENGVPSDLKIACAPLLMDERMFLVRLGIMLAPVPIPRP